MMMRVQIPKIDMRTGYRIVGAPLAPGNTVMT